MKIGTILMITFVGCTMLLALPRCGKKGICVGKNISQSGGHESHNFGENCMQCHYNNGEGYGCFTAAGSVANAALTDNVTSGTIKLYTKPNGEGVLRATLEIDKKGNFYTTIPKNFHGLYPAVTGPDGTTNYMSSKATSVSCNSCHGVSTAAIYTN